MTAKRYFSLRYEFEQCEMSASIWQFICQSSRLLVGIILSVCWHANPPTVLSGGSITGPSPIVGPVCTARTTHIHKKFLHMRTHTHTHTHTHSRWEEQWPLKLLFFNMRRCLDCPLLFFIFSVGLLFRDKLHNLCGHDHMSKVKKM